mgnify:CR=1 FL=1
MKTLAYALAATLLAAAPALAGESNPGENQFHGATAMLSYGAEAQPTAPGHPQAVPAAQPRPAPRMVWGDRAVDPVYFDLAGEGRTLFGTTPAPSQELAAGDDDDFLRPYAN